MIAKWAGYQSEMTVWEQERRDAFRQHRIQDRHGTDPRAFRVAAAAPVAIDEKVILTSRSGTSITRPHACRNLGSRRESVCECLGVVTRGSTCANQQAMAHVRGWPA